MAKEAFTRFGADASLDEIAKQAGVGAGTLYRHFPTRDALIEAVYRSEVEKLAAAARKFAETLPPIDALRAWMLLFVDHIAAKQIIAPALNSVVGGPSRLYEGSRGLIHGAMDALVKRAIKSGDIRKDVDALRPASTVDWRLFCGLRLLVGSKAPAGWWTSSSPAPRPTKERRFRRGHHAGSFPTRRWHGSSHFRQADVSVLICIRLLELRAMRARRAILILCLTIFLASSYAQTPAWMTGNPGFHALAITSNEGAFLDGLRPQ